MIEAMIRDEKRLLSVVIIRPAKDKREVPIQDTAEVDIFMPQDGTRFSGTMPAGGEAAQQVARAIMTVYPVSALPPAERAGK